MIDIQPLTEHGLGVRVTCLDLARALDPSAVDQLLEHLYAAGVVVLPEQKLTGSAFLSVAHALGVADSVRPPEHRLEGIEQIRLQSTTPGVGVNRGGEYWHADGSWRPVPTAATMLRCVVAPERGGATGFVDGRVVYRALTPSLRADVDGSIGYYPVREILAADHRATGINDPVQLAELRNVHHPLVRRHPVTGDAAVIVNQMMLAQVSGPAPGRGRQLLDQIYAIVEDPARVYVHTWGEGDLLLWDNRIVMHRAYPVASSATKVTWRITLQSLTEAATTDRKGL